MVHSASSLPAAAQEQRKRKSISEIDDGVTDVVPAISESDALPLKRQRLIGPTLPSNFADDRKPSKSSIKSASQSGSDSDDDDDDDFGPRLPISTPMDTAPAPALSRAYPKTVNVERGPAPSKRDDWMLIPPSNGDWTARIDPTKLKSRKFNVGKGGRSAAPSEKAANTWHETPAEKQVRLQREIMGIENETTSRNTRDTDTTAKQDEETSKRMQEYNLSRGPTLYEAHQKNKLVEKDDDPSARAFDLEKDIRSGLQPNSTQKKQMMKKAGDFASRFGAAKYL